MADQQNPAIPGFFVRSSAPRQEFYVEGNELVVHDGAHLPSICVKTSQPVSVKELTKEEFTWCSPWIGVLFLISGPLLIIVYFLVRKRCTLTYGLHSDFRKQRRRRTLIKVAVALLLFVAMPFVAILENTAITTIAVIALIIAVIAIFVGNAPLHIVKHSEGRFWVRGFSPEYLKALSNAA